MLTFLNMFWKKQGKKSYLQMYARNFTYMLAGNGTFLKSYSHTIWIKMEQDKNSYCSTPVPVCAGILLTKTCNIQAAYDITTNLLDKKS